MSQTLVTSRLSDMPKVAPLGLAALGLETRCSGSRPPAPDQHPTPPASLGPTEF